MQRIKTWLVCLLAVVTVFMLWPPAASASAQPNQTTILVNQQKLASDVTPQNINNRLMVPFRRIVEALGGFSLWDETKQEVVMVLGNRYVAVTIGSSTMAYGTAKPISADSYMLEQQGTERLDVAPQIMNGRTLVPLRAPLERLGATVVWDEATRTASITAQTGAIPFNVSQFERDILHFTNVQREKYGLSPLQWDDTLANAARDYAQNMHDNQFFSHDGLDGSTFMDRIKRAGYMFPKSGYSAGENLIGGYDSAEEAVDAWMDSPGHRENILNPDFKYLGVGAFKGPNGYEIYAVQEFVGD